MHATLDAPNVARSQAAVPDALFHSMYAELHRLARREVYRQGKHAAGLGVTTVLHEAYLRISGTDGAVFIDQGRFMAYAARVMRGLIIDDVRRRRSQKRGGLFELTLLADDYAERVSDPQALVRIGDALDELAEVDPDLAAIVELKFFCGFTFADIAAMRGVSERTIQRNWEKARLYLHHAIVDDAGPSRPEASCRHSALPGGAR